MLLRFKCKLTLLIWLRTRHPCTGEATTLNFLLTSLKNFVYFRGPKIVAVVERWLLLVVPQSNKISIKKFKILNAIQRQFLVQVRLHAFWSIYCENEPFFVEWKHEWYLLHHRYPEKESECCIFLNNILIFSISTINKIE
jgi:hypothetical protein